MGFAMCCSFTRFAAAVVALIISASSLPAADFAPEFFAFENGTHFPSRQLRIAALKELGYDGIGSANPRDLESRLPLYDAAGLKIFSLYVGGHLGSEKPTYDPIITQAIEQLKDRDTVIELYVQGGPGANDRRAVAFVREIADQAKQSGLRVVLYPHTGFYIETIGDAVRVARLADRDNVGVMFNLCHFLKVEPDSDLRAALEEAKPLLWRVSINGAEVGGKNWNQLIQPLDQGSFNQTELLRILNELGYEGAVGLQCFGIKTPPKENLQRSIEAWKENLKRLP